MSDILTIIIPTRMRPNRLRRAIHSAVATVGMPTTVLVGWDHDLDGYNHCPDYPWLRKVDLPCRHYYVRAVNALYKYAKENIDGFDYFVVCNDDDEFVFPNWGPAAIQALHKQFSDGMGLLELFAPGTIGHWLSRSQFFEETFHGRILEPCYTQYYADGELLDHLRSIACYGSLLHEQQAVISHSLYGTADQLALQVRKAWLESDTEMYKERKNAGLIP